MRSLLAPGRAGNGRDAYAPRESDEPTFVPLGASGVFFNGTLLSFNSSADRSVWYLPIVDGPTGWTRVETVGDVPPASPELPTVAVIRQRLYVIPPGPVDENGTCAAYHLTLDPKRREWTTERIKCPEGWDVYPSGAATVQPLPAGATTITVSGNGMLFTVDFTSSTISTIAKTRRCGALSGHTTLRWRADDLLVFGGSRTDGSQNDTLYALRDATDDYMTEEIVGRLPDDYCDGYAMVFNPASSTLTWVGPKRWQVELGGGRRASGAGTSGSDSDSNAGETAEWSLAPPFKRGGGSQLPMCPDALHVYGPDKKLYVTGGSGLVTDSLFVVSPDGRVSNREVAKDALVLADPEAQTTVRMPMPPIERQQAQSARAPSQQASRSGRSVSGVSYTTATNSGRRTISYSPESAKMKLLLPTMPQRKSSPFWQRGATLQPQPPPPTKSTPRGPNRVVRHQQAVGNQILLNLIRAHHTTAEKTAAALKKAVTHTDQSMLDTSACSLCCDDLFLVKEVVARCPHIRSWNISGHSLDRQESEMVVAVVANTPSILEVLSEGTTFTPETAAEELQEALASNQEAQDARDAEAAEAKKERSEKRRQRREKKRQARATAEAGEVKTFAVEERKAALRIAQWEAIARLRLQQLLERRSMEINFTEGVAAVKRRMEVYAAVQVELIQLEEDEAIIRQNPKKDETRAWQALLKQERLEWNVFSEQLRERKRQVRQLLTELRRENTAERNRIKAEEKEAWESFWREWQAFRRKVEAHELELRQIENAKREFESKQRADRNQMLDSEAFQRDKIRDEERKVYTQLAKDEHRELDELRRKRQEQIRKQREAEAEAKRLAELKANFEERQRQRTQLNDAPPVVSLINSASLRTTVLNDALPLNVLVPEGRPSTAEPIEFDVKVALCPFMKLKTDPINMNYEPGEISNEEWVSKKSTLVGAQLWARFDDVVPGMELIFVPGPNGLAMSGNPMGGGASITDAETNAEIATYHVDTEDEDHRIQFISIQPEHIVAVAKSFHIEQRDVPATVLEEGAANVIFTMRCEFPAIEEGAEAVHSEWSHTVELEMTGPVIDVPRSAATAVFTEGDPVQSFFKSSVLGGLAKHQTFLGAVLTIRVMPFTDMSDVLSLYSTPMMGHSEEDPFRLVNDGNDFGEILQAGCMKVKGRPRMLSSLEMGAQPTEIRLNANATLENVAMLIRSIQFHNDSQNPIESTRQLIVGISFASGLRCHSAVAVSVVGEDDPTVIDFGFPSIPYRVPPTVPPQHEEYVEVSPCYFAAACNVFDVDTTTFTGGYLTVELSNAKPEERLAVEPLPSSPIGIDTEGARVHFDGAEVGSIETSPQKLHFRFGDSSIEAVQALFKAFVFRTSETAPPPQPQPRTVEITFVCGEASPVKTKCQLKVTAPLISVPVRDAFWTFKEDAGLTPIGNFALCTEDDGWDSGFILVEYVKGHTADDLLTIKESNLVKLSETDGAQMRKRSTIRSQREVALTNQKSMMVQEEDSGSLERTSTSPRSITELKSLMRKRVAEKVRQLNEARQKALDELKARILEEARRRRANQLITETTQKPVFVDGVQVATATLSPDSLMVQFTPYTGNDVTKPRVNQCQVRRQQVATVLRHICYQNVSDNPTELQKIFRITASDGTPHTSVAVVEVEVQPSDDATELVRLHHETMQFRSLSPADTAGYVLHHDVQLRDPDTFAFNGNLLTVELIGGGDPKGDQLGLLTAAQQRKRGVSEIETLLYNTETRELKLLDVVIGTVSIDNHGNWIKVAFSKLPEGVAEPKSAEDVEQDPRLISIITVERVLHSITYTNVASKVKPGQRVYQAKLSNNGVEGKLKTTVNVLAPLLWNPEFGAQLRYKENSPPTSTFPKLLINYSDKQALKKGDVVAKITKNIEEADVLNVVLPQKSEYAIQKGSLYCNRDYIGVIATDTEKKSVSLTLDWASKASVKHLQQFIRFIGYSSTSEDPSTEPRTIEVAVNLEGDGNSSSISTQIAVLAEDDPTEIFLTRTHAEAIRDGPKVMLAADAEVVDPDTEHFSDPSYVDVEIKSATVSDHVILDGFNVTAGSGVVRILRNDLTADAEEEEMPAAADAPADDDKAEEETQAAEEVPQAEAPADSDAAEGAEATEAAPEVASATEEKQEGEQQPAEGEPAAEEETKPAESEDTTASSDPSAVIAEASINGKTRALRIRLLNCKLGDIQELVRRVAVRFDSGSKDKSSKKTVTFSCRSGDAPVYRISMNVDIVPPLVELPAALLEKGISYKGAAVDIFPQAGVYFGHFSGGAKIRASFFPDEGSVTPIQHNIVIRHPNKLGVQHKETRDEPADTLLIDGHACGTINASKHTMTVDVTGTTNAGQLVQKVIRTLAFDSVAESLSQPVSVYLSARDLGHGMTFTARVDVQP